MRETPFSNCEREFVLKAIEDRKRLDGRGVYDYRQMRITFGIDRGCCQVELGQTRVLTQVSCEVTLPKQTRPTEGILYVNLELSPMAAPHFEPGRLSNFGVELNRLLERCLMESRCLDTESLCIMAGLKVWTIRVDCTVLNYDGNLMDCCSTAAIAALAHFRRPDVTVSGEDITIHTLEERDPIPLSVHHMPICVTFAFFSQGKFLLVDPSLKEEKVMDGRMVIGMNKHREICTLQMTGSMLLMKDQVLRCSNIAVVKVTEITELIQKALQADAHARSSGGRFGFAASIETKRLTANEKASDLISTLGAEEQAEELVRKAEESEEEKEAEMEDGEVEDEEEMEAEKSGVRVLAPGTAQIGHGGPSTWLSDARSGHGMEAKKNKEKESTEKKQQKKIPASSEAKGKEVIELSDGSEEEEIVTLGDSEFTPSTGVSGKSLVDQWSSESVDLLQALKKSSQTQPRPKDKRKRTGRS